MRKVRVTVPAACTGFGSGLDSLGLALALHNTVEVEPRADGAINLLARSAIPPVPIHPVIQGAEALFKAVNQPMPGLDVRCYSEIPADCGLGDRGAWLAAGMFAANNLLETPMPRGSVAALACKLAERPVEVCTGIFGGLTITIPDAGQHVCRAIELTRPLQVALVVPILADYRAQADHLAPDALTRADLGESAGRAALVVESLRTGDYGLLRIALRDRLREPKLRALIPGYEAAIRAAEAAREEGRPDDAGPIGTALSGAGPALVFFARAGHERIEAAVRGAFTAAGVAIQTWILNVDTQGVAITALRS